MSEKLSHRVSQTIVCTDASHNGLAGYGCNPF